MTSRRADWASENGPCEVYAAKYPDENKNRCAHDADAATGKFLALHVCSECGACPDPESSLLDKSPMLHSDKADGNVASTNDPAVLHRAEAKDGESESTRSSDASNGLSAGAVAGITIVVALLVILLVAGVALLRRRSDNSAAKVQSGGHGHSSASNDVTTLSTNATTAIAPAPQLEAGTVDFADTINTVMNAPEFEESGFALGTDGMSVRLKSVRRQNPTFRGSIHEDTDIVTDSTT